MSHSYGRSAALTAMLLACTCWPGVASAADAAEDNGQAAGQSAVELEDQERKDARVDAGDDTELTAVPIVGGDSDVGVGGGFILSFAKLRKSYAPYLYRLEAVGIVTFKAGEEGRGVQVPYTDNYALLHLPHVMKDELEVELRLNFTREGTLKFYGLGNASRIAPNLDPDDNYFEHSRAHPGLRWRSTYHSTKTIDLLFGATYTQNWLTVRDDTQLAETMRTGSAVERELLGSPKNHGVAQVSGGLAWDSRDSEVSSKRGQYHSVRTDFSPGIGSALPYTWARITSGARVFVPLIPERLTFAARLVADFLVGEVPFYEFVRYDDMFAIGGGSGLRGVPAQRYWGKVKVFSNIELRSELLDFEFWSKKNLLGVTAFLDTGRLWTDYRSLPELDGTSLGLKVGTGLGLRLTAGDSFVLRGDVAWSPDAHPIGAYLTSGQMF